jgi:hypothetical protein
MPVKYSIVKDQTSSVLNLKTSKITFPIQIPEKSPSASSLFVLVGLGRFELPTSPLSGVRSNQLSYRPLTSGFFPIPGGGRIESASAGLKAGGAGRDRTGGLLNANQALSQLSYSPFTFEDRPE